MADKSFAEAIAQMAGAESVAMAAGVGAVVGALAARRGRRLGGAVTGAAVAGSAMAVVFMSSGWEPVRDLQDALVRSGGGV